jgi:broad specificity phosphatase PhoE
MSLAVYVTHPEVRVDPAVPVPDWSLSPRGRARAERLAAAPWVRGLARVVTSTERKAQETAAILARAADVAPETWPDLHENDRSATGYLAPPEFEAAADAFFARPEESVQGWERAVDAQARILRAVRAALAPGGPVAVVGHGAVGTLLWLGLTGRPITRAADQPAGGGHLYAFPFAGGAPLSPWIAFENWTGEDWTGENWASGTEREHIH